MLLKIANFTLCFTTSCCEIIREERQTYFRICVSKIHYRVTNYRKLPFRNFKVTGFNPAMNPAVILINAEIRSLKYDILNLTSLVDKALLSNQRVSVQDTANKL